jgi:hypothetical protein
VSLKAIHMKVFVLPVAQSMAALNPMQGDITAPIVERIRYMALKS